MQIKACAQIHKSTYVDKSTYIGTYIDKSTYVDAQVVAVAIPLQKTNMQVIDG